MSLADGDFLVGSVAALIRLQEKGLTRLTGLLATLALIWAIALCVGEIAQIRKKTSHSIGIKLPKMGVDSQLVLPSVASLQLFSAICC
jgi:preprotein translocase subunit SecG